MEQIQWLAILILNGFFFQNNKDKKILRFPNLKSLSVTRCWLSESLYSIQKCTSLFEMKGEW